MRKSKKRIFVATLIILFLFSAFAVHASSASNLPSIAVLKLSNQDTSVTLKWSKALRAEKYEIYRKTGSEGYKKIGTTCKYSYVDSSVGRKYSKYTYYVVGVNKWGKGKYSPKTIKHIHVHTYIKKSTIKATRITCGQVKYKCSYCGDCITKDTAPTGIGKYQISAFASDLSEALKYQNQELDYEIYDRESLSCINSCSEKGYWKYPDGIYRNKSINKGGVATIVLTGDCMCQTRQQEAALDKYGEYQFKDNLKYVKDIISDADFAVGNLECTTRDSVSYMWEKNYVNNKPNCNAPSTFIGALREAGFDLMVMANNHNCDTGVQGLFETIAHVEQYGLIHTGTFRNSSQKRYVIVEIDGIKVAFLAYSSYFNKKDKYWTQTGQDILLNKYKESRVKADVKNAKEDGAEFIIGYIHAGKEYTHTVTDYQKEICQEMADAGVDYIVGSHPHVLQNYDRLNASDGRTVPVIYSMGNFVSQMKDGGVGKSSSIILKLKLKRDGDGNVIIASEGYIPTLTYQQFNDDSYTTIPLTKPYNTVGTGETSVKEQYDNIVSVIGSELECLGTFEE